MLRISSANELPCVLSLRVFSFVVVVNYNLYLLCKKGRTANKESDLFGDLQVTSTFPVLVSVHVPHGDEHGVDDEILFPVTVQLVSRGDGDQPVAALEISDSVVFARDLDHLPRFGEGDDFLSQDGLAHFASSYFGCGNGKTEYIFLIKT